MKIKQIKNLLARYPDEMDVPCLINSNLTYIFDQAKRAHNEYTSMPEKLRKWHSVIFDKEEFKGLRCKCCKQMYMKTTDNQNHNKDCPVPGEIA